MELEGFEYTQLRELAKSDPEAFEREATRLIDVMIDSYPEAHRKSLQSFQGTYEKQKFLLSDEVWSVQSGDWAQKSASEVTGEVKKFIASAPEKYHMLLKKYQRHLFYALNPYDFEEWRNLYAQDPEKAERKRLRIIEEHISYTSGDEKQTRRFQWRIDAERRKSKTALGSFLFLRNMLLDLVYCDGGFLYQLRQFQHTCEDAKELHHDLEKEERRSKINLKLVPNKTTCT